MTTLVASPSGHLARPGAHLVDLEEHLVVVPRAYERVTATPPPRPTAVTVEQLEMSAREIAWACEWWPPT
jgi:hypothetical protein